MSMLAEAMSVGAMQMVGIMIPTMVGCFREASNGVDKDIKTEIKNLKKACKEVEGSDDVKLSDRVETEIIRLSSKSKTSRKCYVAGAKETQKLIDYAIYYITNEDADLIKLSRADKELVNGIGNYIGYGIIYDGYEPADITKFDAKNLEVGYTGEHILSIEDIDDLVRDGKFKEKWETVKFKRITGKEMEKKLITGPVNTTGVNGRVDENGLIHPLFFGVPGYSQPEYNDGTVSQDEIDIIEPAIKDIIDDYHFYRKDEKGNISLNIERTIADKEGNVTHPVDSFAIDTGRIVGGVRPCVLAKYINLNGVVDTAFLDINKFKDVAREVFKSPFLNIPAEYVPSIMLDGFNDGPIYRYIDMSNTPWFNNISDVNKGKLEKRLIAVGKILTSDIRLRFYSYNGPEDFTLISDSEVVSPIAQTSSGIDEGLMYEVKDNHIKITKNGQIIKEYNIEFKG